MSIPTVALAHDYLTQRGGAERVALIMAQAFRDAPLYTTLYNGRTTFPEFSSIDVRVSALNHVALLRSRHRLALPLLAGAASSLHIDADVVLVSSSGWAHGVRTTGRKIVYCHAPARWLYQTDRYVGAHSSDRVVGRLHKLPATLALAGLAPSLRRWDHRAASTADRYLANSTVTRDAIRMLYGIDAEILPPPPALLPDGPETPAPGIEPGYFLCVARLLPYKNVDAVIAAVSRLRGARLVVVGVGPEWTRLQKLAAEAGNVDLVGGVNDSTLRWLYRNCRTLVAASYEDYGLSPLEAAAFGKPTVALNVGGYLDTVVDGATGVLIPGPAPEDIRAGLEFADTVHWDATLLKLHAADFSAERFGQRLRTITGVSPVPVATAA